jgi:enamine deaminase RidA (YjgF/YER057c/UK114 family)
MVTAIEERLRELGIELPAALQPLTDHASIITSRGLGFLAGHGPMDARRNPLVVGVVGTEVTEEEGNRAARLAALNAVATMRAALGSLDRVDQVVRLTGYVLSAPGFARQPWVVDGASQLLVQIFGPERGRHARTSVGVASSALRMSVTLDIVIAISD